MYNFAYSYTISNGLERKGVSMDKVSFGFIKSVHLSMDHKVRGVIKSMS